MNPDFYIAQTSFSQPGKHAALYDALPDTIDELCQVVRGIYVHYFSKNRISAARKKEVELRYISAILDRVVELDSRPLTQPRPVTKKVVCCCRDASLLLCSMLRHKGIPARIRIGFAPYNGGMASGFNHDHVVTEYWDAAAGRWKLVDAEQDAALIEKNQIDFDVHDIPRDKFLVGGAAWQKCRAGEAKDDDFGVSRTDFFKGWWAIRNRMLQDLNTLNKIELLLWDSWGWMEYDFQPGGMDIKLLDQIAALTQSDDLAAIQAQMTDPRFAAPKTVMNYSPVVKWGKVQPVY